MSQRVPQADSSSIKPRRASTSWFCASEGCWATISVTFLNNSGARANIIHSVTVASERSLEFSEHIMVASRAFCHSGRLRKQSTLANVASRICHDVRAGSRHSWFILPSVPLR